MSQPPIPELQWLIERRDNCVRIADLKTGDDRDSWLEDADYFNKIIERIAALEAQNLVLREENQTLREAIRIAAQLPRAALAATVKKEKA